MSSWGPGPSSGEMRDPAMCVRVPIRGIPLPGRMDLARACLLTVSQSSRLTSNEHELSELYNIKTNRSCICYTLGRQRTRCCLLIKDISFDTLITVGLIT